MARLNWGRPCFAGQWAIRHGRIVIAESFSFVRRQAAASQTESDSLWTVFSAMALFAEQLGSVFGDGGGIEHLITHGAFKADAMKFITAGYPFFSRVNHLFTAGTLRWHICTFQWY